MNILATTWKERRLTAWLALCNGYAWDFGDGTSAEGQVVSHTFENAGSYTVTMTMTYGAGQSAERTRKRPERRP